MEQKSLNDALIGQIRTLLRSGIGDALVLKTIRLLVDAVPSPTSRTTHPALESPTRFGFRGRRTTNHENPYVIARSTLDLSQKELAIKANLTGSTGAAAADIRILEGLKGPDFFTIPSRPPFNRAYDVVVENRNRLLAYLHRQSKVRAALDSADISLPDPPTPE